MLHIYSIKPRYSSVLVTGEKYTEDQIEKGIIIANKGDLKLHQTVLAVGSMVRDINVGDKIMFNPRAYCVMKYDKNSLQNDLDNNKIVKWNLPWVTIDDENGNPKDCLLLKDTDIEFVYEGEEKNNSLIVEAPKISLN